MDALPEMRAEASRLADGDIAAILEIALKNLKDGRWAKLRRNLIEPENEKERAYMSALSTYVYNKLALRRELNFYGYAPHRTNHEVAMNKARNRMDRIESGVPEVGEYAQSVDGEIAEYSLPMLTAHDSIEVKLSPKEAADLIETFGSVHRNFSIDKIDPKILAELIGEPGSIRSALAPRDLADIDKTLAEKALQVFKEFPPIKTLFVKAPDEGYVFKTRSPYFVRGSFWSDKGEAGKGLPTETPGEAPAIRDRDHNPISMVKTRLSRGEIKGGGEV